MTRAYGLDHVARDTDSIVTQGTFDGVHVGHQVILKYLVRRAKERGGKSVVVTFDPHPREVVHGIEVPLLATVDERAEAIEHLGVDRFIVIQFTKAFSKLSAEDFVVEVLEGQVGLKEIVIGYDHGFGRGREGDSELLETLGAMHGFTVDVIPPQEVEHLVVSSSKIRDALVEVGDVGLAAEMLGRTYELTGTVVRGEQRGRTIGFPTANLRVDHPRKVIPKIGVYAVRARVGGEQEVLDGMMNIGIRPTFESEGLHLEVHLFGFERDLYDQQLRIEFVERIRDERKFDGVDALVEQLSRDRARCKTALEKAP